MRSLTPLPRKGLTLLELLIVMAIIALISVATIPVAMSALGDQEISGAAATVQATFTSARDTAKRTGRPAGLRLLPDPDLDGGSPIEPSGDYLRRAANRILELQAPPDHTDGQVIRAGRESVMGVTYADVPLTAGGTFRVYRLAVVERKTEDHSGIVTPVSPTGWFSNIRQGDKIEFNGTKLDYIIAGPMSLFNTPDGSIPGGVVNPDRFIYGDCDLSTAAWESSIVGNTYSEYLFVVNGRDDDSDGYIDEQFDGINNNNDFYPAGHAYAGQPIIDPGFNGIDDNENGLIDEPSELLLFHNGTTFVYNPALAEYEPDDWIGTPVAPGGGDFARSYAILRRPMPAPDSREVQLPGNTVIDLTTSALPILGVGVSERSRVPIDPYTGYIDFLIYPTGQIVPSTHTGNFAQAYDFPSFSLWISTREDIRGPLFGVNTTTGRLNPNPDAPAFQYHMPMHRGTQGYLDHDNDGVIDPAFSAVSGNYLEGDRRIVTIDPRTGRASVSPITFDPTNINSIYMPPQSSGTGN